YVVGANDLPTNPGLRPLVLGPGDEVTVKFPDRDEIRSVQGRWRGNPEVKVLNAAEVGAPPTLTGAGRADSWGDEIRVKPSEKNLSGGLSARLKVPNNPALGGKTLRVKVTMNVMYPSAEGNSRFLNRTTTVSREFTLRLAEAKALRDYRTA